MKELEINIRKNGFEYRQVAHTPFGYIYSQSSEGRLIAYEVFKRVENDYYNCVSFPGNEAFGHWAWTFHRLEDAYNKLSEIQKMFESKQEAA